MGRYDPRSFPPPPTATASAPPPPRRGRRRRAEADDDHPRRPLMIYALLCALVLGAGGFLWRAYDDGSGGVPVRVAPAQDRFKEPGPDAGQAAPAAPPVEDQLRAGDAAPIEGFAQAPEEPILDPDAAALAAPEGPPAFVNNGPFVAQIAALQSEDGISPLWRRLSDRAPDLFADARMDVQRADLGARGVYLRVRVGYFADRDNAARFCARMRAMGQDCMAVER